MNRRRQDLFILLLMDDDIKSVMESKLKEKTNSLISFIFGVEVASQNVWTYCICLFFWTILSCNVETNYHDDYDDDGTLFSILFFSTSTFQKDFFPVFARQLVPGCNIMGSGGRWVCWKKRENQV